MNTTQDLLEVELDKLVAADKKKWAELDRQLGVLPKNPDNRNMDAEESEAEEFFFRGEQ